MPAAPNAFTPKLATVLQEGYGWAGLRADALAGLTVAIVALPLSMAIAIASGVGPERGLFTAIAGGFAVSLFSGSRFQIGGPAGAFIVLVMAAVRAHGIDGLLLATLLSGLMLLAAGALRLGSLVRYVPHPVVIGFTAGIAVIIFASQLTDLLGLHLDAPEPGELLPKLAALAAALPTANPWSAALAALTAGIILALRHWRPRWPALLIAVAAAACLASALHLPVETIATRFGGLPSSLPAPAFPALSWAGVAGILPVAASFALLGSIESLLSAVVADKMSGRTHRPNMELLAQGAANIVSPLFGGFCVTGTIARTAINVRAGARSPVAGMLHAVFLLIFMAVAAPLAGYIPLAALAGLLATVAWGMLEHRALAATLRTAYADAAVVLATLGLTVLRSLIEGIVAGILLTLLLRIWRR